MFDETEDYEAAELAAVDFRYVKQSKGTAGSLIRFWVPMSPRAAAKFLEEYLEKQDESGTA